MGFKSKAAKCQRPASEALNAPYPWVKRRVICSEMTRHVSYVRLTGNVRRKGMQHRPWSRMQSLIIVWMMMLRTRISYKQSRILLGRCMQVMRFPTCVIALLEAYDAFSLCRDGASYCAASSSRTDVWTTDQFHASCLRLSHDEPPRGTRLRPRRNQTGGRGTATTRFRGPYVAAVCRCGVARDDEVASSVTPRYAYIYRLVTVSSDMR